MLFRRIVTVVMACVAIVTSPVGKASEVVHASTVSRENYDLVVDYDKFDKHKPIEAIDNIRSEITSYIAFTIQNNSISRAQFRALVQNLKQLLANYKVAYYALDQLSVDTPEMKEVKARAVSIYSPYIKYFTDYINGVIWQSKGVVFNAAYLVNSIEGRRVAFREFYSNLGKNVKLILKQINTEYGSLDAAQQHFEQAETGVGH